MSKVINITDKLSSEKPAIVIGERTYPVDDSMETLLKFQELASNSTMENMEKAIAISLGEDALETIEVKKYSISNFKVLCIAILAAMQQIDYEEAEARFQKSEQ